jgi:hypothetical protein
MGGEILNCSKFASDAFALLSVYAMYAFGSRSAVSRLDGPDSVLGRPEYARRVQVHSAHSAFHRRIQRSIGAFSVPSAHSAFHRRIQRTLGAFMYTRRVQRTLIAFGRHLVHVRHTVGAQSVHGRRVPSMFVRFMTHLQVSC